ncbi:hypothetical protein JOF41_000577 [Saccharothrix coeruleofusca]|nr:hypothetical protein [Saccharothrix coeruleofusca]
MVMLTDRSRDGAVPCPICRTATVKVHGYHHRTVKDVPVDGRQVVVHLCVRRLVCPVWSCLRPDLPRTDSGSPGTPPAPHGAARSADIADDAGVVRSGGRTPDRSVGRAGVPQHRVAPSAAARTVGSTSDRRGRFRSAPTPLLRHGQHRCRDLSTCRGSARPRRGHPVVLAARTSRHPRSWSCAGMVWSPTPRPSVRPTLPDAIQVSLALWRDFYDKVLLEARACRVPGHRQPALPQNTLCPHARSPGPAHRPHLPPNPPDPLPRSSARPMCGRPRVPITHLLAEIRELGYLHRQCEPIGPLPQPGPCRRRATGHALPSHQLPRACSPHSNISENMPYGKWV